MFRVAQVATEASWVVTTNSNMNRPGFLVEEKLVHVPIATDTRSDLVYSILQLYLRIYGLRKYLEQLPFNVFVKIC